MSIFFKFIQQNNLRGCSHLTHLLPLINLSEVTNAFSLSHFFFLSHWCVSSARVCPPVNQGQRPKLSARLNRRYLLAVCGATGPQELHWISTYRMTYCLSLRTHAGSHMKAYERRWSHTRARAESRYFLHCLPFLQRPNQVIYRLLQSVCISAYFFILDSGFSYISLGFYRPI